MPNSDVFRMKSLGADIYWDQKREIQNKNWKDLCSFHLRRRQICCHLGGSGAPGGLPAVH